MQVRGVLHVYQPMVGITKSGLLFWAKKTLVYFARLSAEVVSVTLAARFQELQMLTFCSV